MIYEKQVPNFINLHTAIFDIAHKKDEHDLTSIEKNVLEKYGLMDIYLSNEQISLSFAKKYFSSILVEANLKKIYVIYVIVGYGSSGIGGKIKDSLIDELSRGNYSEHVSDFELTNTTPFDKFINYSGFGLGVIKIYTSNTYKNGDFRFCIVDNEACLIEYLGESSTVFIPSKIKVRSGIEVHVKSIKAFLNKGFPPLMLRTMEDYEDDYDFDEDDNIEEFEDNSISRDYNSNEMTINIPSSIININDYAFFEVRGFKKISFDVESKLEKIGDFAFSQSEIMEITIPKNVRFIGVGAFEDCHGLKKLIFEKESRLEKISSRTFSNGSPKKIIIPKNVKTIEEGAFEEAYELEQLDFENGSKLESIGKNAFMRTNIRFITIPASVKIIDRESFAYTRLKNVSFEHESQLRKICSGAFDDSPLEKIHIPESVIEIQDFAIIRKNITIYVEANSKPSGWSKYWCNKDAKVVWGYKDNIEDF